MRPLRGIDDNDLKDILINPKLNRTGQYICDCPFCGKESHFYVSKSKQMYDCKRCGVSGGIYSLLKHLGKTYLLGGATVEDRSEGVKSIADILREEAEAEEVAEEELPKVKLPIGCKRIKESKYLRDRGITDRDFERYYFFRTKVSPRHEGYLIMPVYDDWVIRGYVGRWEGRNVPKNKLRYNNSVGTQFGDLLYGYDDIARDGSTSTVVLVEGIFDKIAVDKILNTDADDSIKCVATFGKKISRAQINKLKSRGVSSVILLYDFDAINDMKRYGVELSKYFDTSITYTNGKDIDECSEKEALSVFENLYDPMSFCVEVATKIKK